MGIFITKELVAEENMAHAEMLAIRGVVEAQKYEYRQDGERDKRNAEMIAKLPDVARRVANCHNAGTALANTEAERLAVREIATRLAEKSIGTIKDEEDAAAFLPVCLWFARAIVENTAAPAAPAPEATASNA